MSTCLFCKFVAKEIPTQIVKENEHALAFRDINPVAPTHVLVIPKKHVASIAETTAADAETIAHVMAMAREVGLAEHRVESGYRIVMNHGPDAGQSVFHWHVHVLGGRSLAWPPG